LVSAEDLDKLSMLDVPRFEWDIFGTFWCTVATVVLAGSEDRDTAALG
jgi:hypothetical protein